MHELLFRSRWYAFAWAMFMAMSAVMFTMTGVGASLTSSDSNTRVRQEARESAYSAWAEDDKRRTGDETGYDPSSPERVRDGLPPREDMAGAQRRTVPFSEELAEDESANPPLSQ